MTEDQFRNLETGDIVQAPNGEGYIVTSNYGGRLIAVRTIWITNPSEWRIEKKISTSVIPQETIDTLNKIADDFRKYKVKVENED